MVSFTSLFVLLAAGSALAAPSSNVLVARQQGRTPSNWKWSVTNYNGGCARQCSYDFNVTIPATSDIPGVKAYCSGMENGSQFNPCRLLEGGDNNVGVAAKYLERDQQHPEVGPKQIAVNYLVGYQDGARYSYTAYADAVYNAFAAPPANFEMTPTETTAVA